MTIRRSVVVVVFLTCGGYVGSAQAPPQVSFRVVETDPASRVTLDGREPVYLRIAYTSDVPVRFRAKGYSRGTLIEEGAAYNPAPVYPAGEGEALAWLSFDDAVEIDEIRITALDDRWREVGTEHLSKDVRWSGGMPGRGRQPAAWASRMSDAQQHMSSSAQPAGDQDDCLGGLLIALMGWSIPAYLVLQGYMLLRFQNGWRTAAMMPLIAMIPLALYTLFGLFAGSNLWPLLALFLTPLALAYLLVLWFLKSLTARQTQHA